jgi:hypothetical protein
MIGGLDLVIINAVKGLVAPIVGLTGSPWLSVLVLLYPGFLIVSKRLDNKIKERSKKK